MKVRLPMMVQDQALAGVSKLVEGFDVTDEPYFLDGPVTERVAILDFDEETGELLPGTPFCLLRPTAAGPRGEYRINKRKKLRYKSDGKWQYHINTRDFNRVSVLATILRTMSLFQDEYVLGRKLHWAFDGPQLLVIPRAGEWANAFYQRETSSLQFFYFPKVSTAANGERELVYTSLSRDIISHETAHAILDGIAPHLYNASTPQSLAMHESVADLTAVILAFRSSNLSRAVLEETGGKINKPSQFSQIAEEFGREHSGSTALRELYNPDIQLGEVSEEPHFLSVVLSSALYDLMLHFYETQWAKEIPRFEKKNEAAKAKGEPIPYEDPRLSSSGKALAISVMQFQRVILGALDYLPPGEVSFADYGRAIIANLRNVIDHEESPRNWRQLAKKRIDFLVDAFEKRGIPLAEKMSEMEIEYGDDLLDGVDLNSLMDSDWVAYQFANKHRQLLSIPQDVNFEVQSRYTARKRMHPKKEVYQNLLFFKVNWTAEEPIVVLRRGIPRKRRITLGTTLVVDMDRQRPVALLHTDNDPDLKASRDRMLALLLERDLLRIGPEAYGPHGEKLEGIIQAENTAGALKLTGVANMLHIAHQ